ncbi:heme o synthase [Cobetia amphilecti]|uniref:Protoheme IX farnesyltransferase n=2 Tax=Cobetia amphilecti TaxID=1055104 RepID=A0AAP4TZX4_9GAMM|nr:MULTISPECIES: heme o synthase [Cobetia]MDO6672793.1 heme o synthase [Cobetia amphilecti]MDO6816019.1 heme o synthase [Cobetia amphilecti]UTV88551.1 heme o synthase [Cobetia litoralis]WOI27515.1 heme o synthase [Cobetia amphilecti]
MMIKDYLRTTKPGIIFGNLITVSGGFFLASGGEVDWALFIATLVGVALIVASGCVFNNCIDRDIDRHMARTQGRALVQGDISLKGAFVFGSVLGLAGFWLLAAMTNLMAMIAVGLGFVIYVGAYSMWLKRGSVYGTLIGSLSGAAPPVVGYLAVTGQADMGALLLLIIFSMWQMPHSYAIAMFRVDDYRAANIPVLPVARGMEHAKRVVTGYIAGFIPVSLLLTLWGYTGIWYLVVATVTGGWWLYLAAWRLKDQPDASWARKLFGFSIIIVMALSLMMSLDTQL